MKECPVCGVKAQNSSQKSCNNCGANFSGTPQYNYEVQKAVQSNMPMKWYKALIYVILFPSALLTLIQAINMIKGETVYNDMIIKFDVGVPEIMYSVGLFASAIFTIYVRQLLAKYKSNAPTMLTLLLSYNIVIELLYTLVTLNTNNTNGDWIFSLMFTIGIKLVITVQHSKYFKNREHLFCK